MENVIKRHTISFKNAFIGLLWAYQTQPNYLIHLLLSILSIIGGYYWSISFVEWLVIIILITLGFVIETINTAIELTGDAIDKNYREDIGRAKDVSAAAMLVYALGAFAAAVMIFAPKLF